MNFPPHSLSDKNIQPFQSGKEITYTTLPSKLNYMLDENEILNNAVKEIVKEDIEQAEKERREKKKRKKNKV